MKNYHCVIFDLDGTLMDTSSGILKCIDYVANQFQLTPPSESEKRGFIGPPIQKSFQSYYGCPLECSLELADAWRKAYKDKYLLEAKPYKGIFDLLGWIRQGGVKTAVATNKREDYAMTLLEHFGFFPLFDCIIGSDFSGDRRKEEMIRLCAERLGIIDISRCLMVGDTAGDMSAAHKAGVDFLGVTYGFGFKRGNQELGYWTADHCEDIRNFLEN